MNPVLKYVGIALALVSIFCHFSSGASAASGGAGASGVSGVSGVSSASGASGGAKIAGVSGGASASGAPKAPGTPGGAEISGKVSAQRSARPASQGQPVLDAVSAGPQKAGKTLSPLVYVSLQDPDMDWWYRIPSNSGPRISDTRKIFFGEDFNVFAFVGGAGATTEGKFKLEYSLSLLRPDGKRVDIVKNVPFSGDRPSADMILACPDVATLRFDDTYPDGRYEVELSVKDVAGGTQASARAPFYTYKWSPPNPYVERSVVRSKVRNFFEEPSPESLYAIYFSKDFNLEQKNAPNSLNFSYIGFLRAAFKNNAFLIPYIRAAFPDSTPLDRAKIVFLFEILKVEGIDASLLNDAEKKYQQLLRAAEIPDPYGEWDPVYAATQIDMLWGEFYATGSYKPLRRIIDLIGLTEDAAYADKLRAEKKRPETKEQWRKFMLGMASRAALKTLAVNYQKIDLAAKYIEWALANGDIPDGTRKILVEDSAPSASPAPSAPAPSAAAHSKAETPGKAKTAGKSETAGKAEKPSGAAAPGEAAKSRPPGSAKAGNSPSAESSAGRGTASGASLNAGNPPQSPANGAAARNGAAGGSKAGSSPQN